MANIRITALPSDASPSSSDVVALDGSTTRKATLTAVVSAGRPFASQAEAEAGTSATLAMNPLTTKQAITALGEGLYASASQGVLATSAVQPGDLAAIATSGSYSDLSGTPTLGTAAATDSNDYAPAGSGLPTGGIAGQVLVKDSSGDYDAVWQATALGSGDMLSSAYDPQAIGADAFDRANHTGAQAISTVTGLQTALDEYATGPLGELWNAAVPYYAGKRVEHDGVLWYAILDNTNVEPGSNAAVWGQAWTEFAGGILTEKLTLAASTVDRASLSLASGSAPAVAVNGDIWREGVSLKIRYTGATGNIMADLDPSSWPGRMALTQRVATNSSWTSIAPANIIPLDDTAPQAAEGIQILSGSFTPRAAAHIYQVEASVPIYAPGAATLVLALFNGSTCIGASVETFTAAGHRLVTVKTYGIKVVPGTTAQTISLRAGAAAGGGVTLYCNGDNTGRKLGGMMASSIDVIEEAV